MSDQPKCIIDRSILNDKTLVNMDDIGLSFFAKLCGNNRGVFVVDPPDGKTYGCIDFPDVFATSVGLNASDLHDSVHVDMLRKGGNATASQVVDILDMYVQAVYTSSAGNDETPFGCDVGGLATLEGCPSTTTTTTGVGVEGLLLNGDVVRSVTLAGAFVPAPWVTGGKTLTMDEVKLFYAQSDFHDMAKLGVNAVQIPVPCDAFYIKGNEVQATITRLLDRAANAGLGAVLVLVPGKVDVVAHVIQAHVTAAAYYASSNPTVIALQLPSSDAQLVGIARSKAAELALLIPTTKGQMNTINQAFADGNVFAALDVGLHGTVADVASSDSLTDRMKMFYHESLVCMDRSPIEWLECYRGMPVYVSSGFDLAVDDCYRAGEKGFRDYGQCERFNETIDSGWWERHRQSLASRQLFSYSLGLGWSFTAWKLYDGSGSGGDGGNTKIIDVPARLLCLRDVVEADLMPSLKAGKKSGAACLNGPKNDFAMGDETFAPTPSPPPDCGNGWWNATTLRCDYWVPPPNTPAPAPTLAPAIHAGMVAPWAVGGAIVGFLMSWMAMKMMTNRTAGYSPIDNINMSV